MMPNQTLTKMLLRNACRDLFAMAGCCIVVSFISGTAFGQSVVNAGTIQVSTLGHIFSPASAGGGPIVRDYFIDQQQTSGGGGLIGAVAANFDTNSQFALTITAPPGNKFLIHVPAASSVTLGGRLVWNTKYEAYGYYSGSVTASFTGLSGTAPTFSGVAFISQDHLVFGFSPLGSSQMSADISFTTITLTGTAKLNQNIGLGTQNYYPTAYPDWPNNAFYAMYYPPSGQTNDPGSFVSIIPVPTLQIAPGSSGIAVSWPTNFSNWALETAPRLGSTNSWSVVTNSRAISGANCVVTNPATAPGRYYRLRSP